MQMTTKRWSTTSCAISTPTITTNLLSDEQLRICLPYQNHDHPRAVSNHDPNPLLDNITALSDGVGYNAGGSLKLGQIHAVCDQRKTRLLPALHIGVGLSATITFGYQRQPRVLLVCDAGKCHGTHD